tara:strand:- start:646 stop:828 length:183 start_codon:yes stop_codon:yes gene_type:complete
MKIRSDLEVLRQLAADFHSDGHAKIATYIRNSCVDIMHLQEALAAVVFAVKTITEEDEEA